MRVITSGSSYLDIDAYAGCIAEAERLNLTGEQAYAASSAPLNESVTESLRLLDLGLVEYQPSANDEFVLVDISVEEYFDPIVQNGTVVEVIDHHPGNEQYWLDRIGDRADIEFIGASCTQIFERWQKSGELANMKPGIARLLAAGILDNTLNLEADVTTQRDKKAYETLRQIGELPEDFAMQYFMECQQAIDADLKTAIRNDTKLMSGKLGLPRALGQVAAWDAKKYTEGNLSTIEAVLSQMSDDWALNLISIGEGKNYIVSTSPTGQEKMASLMGLEFVNGVAETQRLYLRKEILKLALDKDS